MIPNVYSEYSEQQIQAIGWPLADIIRSMRLGSSIQIKPSTFSPECQQGKTFPQSIWAFFIFTNYRKSRNNKWLFILNNLCIA